jgi:hypothetical protein
VPDTSLLTNPPASRQRKRERFIGFARDEATAAMLREVLASPIHIAGFRGALASLSTITTPEIVLIDLSGEDQPISAVAELADAVQAGTVVLAIGEIQNLNFYRSITKGFGIKEYLPKPLTRAEIETNFLPVIGGVEQEVFGQRGGRMITVTGTRGGVGTSTIAANLAWAQRRSISTSRPMRASAPRWNRPNAWTNCLSSAPPSQPGSACMSWPGRSFWSGKWTTNRAAPPCSCRPYDRAIISWFPMPGQNSPLSRGTCCSMPSSASSSWTRA